MLKLDSIHSIHEYVELLQGSTTIYIDDARLSRAFKELPAETGDYRALATMWMRIESAGKYTYLSKDNIIDLLLDLNVDLDKRFRSKKTKGYSLDNERVVKPLIAKGIVPELLTYYSKYRTGKSCISILSNLASSRVIHDVTPTGRRILKYNTNVGAYDNLRAYYSDIAVISIPKAYSNIITTPDDLHYLVWCDFPQADWRFAYNMFIRDDSNRELMSKCDDAYEGLARMIHGDKFDYDEFKANRSEFKVHCLACFYGSRNADPIPTAIRNYFLTRPKYKKLLFDLDVLYQFGVPIPCVSYLGYEQMIPEGTYRDGFMNKSLNTPIQTMTSHIVIETVFGILQKFWDLGYTKDDINIYYVRHDEPIFTFSKKILKDAWVLKECSEIYLPGFTPIHLDFHFGQYYLDEDAKLTREVNDAIEASYHVYEDFGQEPEKDYSPFPSVECIYIRLFVEDDNPDQFRCEVYNYRTNTRRLYYTPKCSSEDAVFNVLNDGAIEDLGSPKYLLVRTNGLSLIGHAGKDESTFVKVIAKPDPSIMMTS